MTECTPLFNPFEKLPTLEEARAMGLTRFHDPVSFDKWLAVMMTRDAFIEEYGFSVPCREAIDLLAKYGPILEVGAGSGYWSKLMDMAGIDVVSTDAFEPEWLFKVGKHFRVECMTGITAVREYRDRTVFMSWPNREERWAYLTASELKVGQILIYIGAPDLTADDLFHELLFQDFSLIEELAVPQFPGMNDRLGVYERVLS